MRRLVRASTLGTLLLIMGLASASSTFANSVSNMTLEKKVALSDVVFIGRAVTNKAENQKGLPGDQFVTVEPMTIIKGTAPKFVEVLVRGMIAEQDPICCTLHMSYLFFLKKLKGAEYESVNGPFGIYPMDSNHSESH